MSGINFFTAVGIVPNLRLGFYGIRGTKSNSQQKSDTSVVGYDYKASLTGLHIDYGFVLFDHFAILPGLGFGWLTTTIESYKTQQNIDKWTPNYPQNDKGYFRKAEGEFFFINPTINLEYALTQFSAVRASIGYSIPFNLSWTENNYSTLKNMPNNI